MLHFRHVFITLFVCTESLTLVSDPTSLRFIRWLLFQRLYIYIYCKCCKCCNHMQHSSSHTSKVTGKQYKIFCTINCKSANVIYILECSVCGLQYVGESRHPFHRRLNGHRSDRTKRHFFLWASTPDCLTTVSRISTEWKSSSLNITLCGVIFNLRIGKDFGLKNSVFYIRTVLTENNRFLCIFSFTVFIVNEYFTTVTKLRICAHHLLLTIILCILKWRF